MSRHCSSWRLCHWLRVCPRQGGRLVMINQTRFGGPGSTLMTPLQDWSCRARTYEISPYFVKQSTGGTHLLLKATGGVMVMVRPVKGRMPAAEIEAASL